MDIRGLYFKYTGILYSELKKNIYTVINLIDCFLRGVDLKLSNKFIGKSMFIRKPNSKIIVGESNLFLSDTKTNLIGVNRPCILSTHSQNASIVIGNNCGFSGTVIGSTSSIRIGSNVLCGANTTITDFDWHAVDPKLRMTGKVYGSPIEIGDNVWLGYNVLILKGVSIGSNSVIGANSVVTKDIPKDVIAAGNPCKVIKKL